ncbi:hypothetical protein U0070_018007 [Myodes glareolus]|uniref:Uncharacterized protein n=1 Tax=Myodes glareolus TaxID=447135 RepID=A0AAW0HWW5_MYOGA
MHSAKPSLTVLVDSAPEVTFKEDLETGIFLLSRYAEPAHINDFMFEQQTEYMYEKDVTKPSEEEQKELDEITAKKQKKKANRKRRDQERRRQSYMLKKCMTIKADPTFTYLRMLVLMLIYGHLCHLKNVIFPKNKFMCDLDTQRVHLLLSCSMDCKIKLWKAYGDWCCLRTFIGHSKAVRDICFNTAETQFLSEAYDRAFALGKESHEGSPEERSERAELCE